MIRRATISLIYFLLFFLFQLSAESLSEDQILSGADDRIELYRKGTVTLKLIGSDGLPLSEGINISIAQQNHAFLFGCASTPSDRFPNEKDNQLYEQQFLDVFNYTTLGFHWGESESPEEVTAREADTRRIAQWCADNNIRTKSALFWTNDPDWLNEMDANEAEQTVWRRVEHLVSSFSGLIDTWDVVNEPSWGQRQAYERHAQNAISLYERDGAVGIILRAFSIAESANPSATLVLNDYLTGNAYAQIVDESLKKGAGIDVIGMQAHMHSSYWGAKKTWDKCERFSMYGKPLHITEVTLVSGPSMINGWPTTASGEKRQAERAAEFYRVLFSHPAVEAITWWDFSDRGAWRAAPAGLLRDDMSPKPAYDSLKTLIKEEWWSQEIVSVGPLGAAEFRGFFGDYTVSATVGDVQIQGEFSLNKGTESVAVEMHLLPRK
jgi:endo-1,4-beta-xylanase